MSYADHDHRGDYADQRHDHDNDYAERHRHYDDESAVRGLRQDLGAAEQRIGELEDGLRDALYRIHALEDREPDYVSAEESRGDPDEPTNRELEPEPPGWYDVPEPEERGVSEYNREEFALDRGEEP